MKTVQVLDQGHMRRFWSTADIPAPSYKPLSGSPINTSLSVSSGMVLSCPFNEGSGDTASDTTASPLTGTLSSGSMWGLDDTYTHILNFSGEYAEIPHNAKNDIETYSISLAFRSTQTSPFGTLLGKQTSAGAYPFTIYLGYPDAGKVSFYCFDGSADPGAFTSGTYNDGSWQKLTVTRVQGGAMNLFLNGVLRANGTDTTDPNSTQSTGTIKIGVNGPYGSPFVGDIAYLHMWNRVLSGAPGSVGDAATGEIAALNTDEFLMYR